MRQDIKYLLAMRTLEFVNDFTVFLTGNDYCLVVTSGNNHVTISIGQTQCRHSDALGSMKAWKAGPDRVGSKGVLLGELRIDFLLLTPLAELISLGLDGGNNLCCKFAG